MKNMTASVKQMTDGQINKAVADYRAMLEKHAPQFSSESVQIVLGQPEFVKDQFDLFRRRVEMFSSNLIFRHVTVDRSRNPRASLGMTGRNLHVNDEVMKTMPKGNGAEVDVVFFKLGHNVGDTDLEKEYELLGLVPADPYSLAKVNEDDPAFADGHPNGTHWKDTEDEWCFATFCRWFGERAVGVNRNGHDWRDDWWFAGIRKSS
jgi:hypothetical protein